MLSHMVRAAIADWRVLLAKNAALPGSIFAAL